MPTSRLLLAILFCSAACTAPTQQQPNSGGVAAPPWMAPDLASMVSVRDGHDGNAIELEDLFAQLAQAEAVFLGETHLDETTHRLELAVYEALLERHDGRVVLSLEMFERDAQPDLDAYVQGRIDEPTFLERTRPWGNHREAYRPLVQRARAQGLPVIAANFPAPVRRRMASEGAEKVLAELAAEGSELVPSTWHANTPDYWKRVDNAIRGHIGMMGPPPAADDPRLHSTQSLWDNSMGDAVARALEQHPGHVVLHVQGGFHGAYWDGSVRQLLLRRPQTRVRTVSIVPSATPFSARTGGIPVADFVALAEARAEDKSGSTRSVRTTRDVRYRLHVPDAASDSSPAPLLVWLGDDGFTSAEGLALARARLGDGVAVLALDPLHRGIEDDLMPGGRWFWDDSFNADLGAAQHAVESAWAYVLRHHPVDPERVLLAGRGTGATLAGVLAVHGARMPVDVLAFQPTRFAKVKDMPLPLPELRVGDEPRASSLRLWPRPKDTEWWRKELAQVRAGGLDARLEEAPQDDSAPARFDPQGAALRAWFSLPDLRASLAANGRTFVHASPRARAWALLENHERVTRGEAAVAIASAAWHVEGDLREGFEPTPEDAREAGLPRSSGAFGGTTVLVAPDDMAPEAREAWKLLVDEDPLNEASRFHRLRYAESEGELALSTVLATLRDEGRNNVLVVPIAFHAGAERMRELAASVRDVAGDLSLSWRPGLGGLGSD